MGNWIEELNNLYASGSLDKMTEKREMDEEEIKEALCGNGECQDPIAAGARVQCSLMLNPEVKVVVVPVAPIENKTNGGIGLRDIDTRFLPPSFGFCKETQRTCQPMIGTWQSCSNNGINNRWGVAMNSYILCSNGGNITLVTDGQTVGSANGHDFKKLVEWMKNAETNDEDFIKDDKGNKVAIKIQNAKDGCVTIGYGHILQTKSEIKYYGFEEWEEEILTNIALKEEIYDIDIIISEQRKKYEGKDNPAILSLEEAEGLLYEDIEEAYAIVLEKKWGKGFSENEIDALTSNVFNAGISHCDDEDSLQYYLIRDEQDGAMKVLHDAVEMGWYEGQMGLFRRRLMEYKIFFLDNEEKSEYDFYDSSQLDELKNAVGYD